MKKDFDPALFDLYSRTTYAVRGRNGREVFFKIHEAGRNRSLKGKCFAIVTAWNPGSRLLSEEENRKRNRRLERELSKTPYVFYASRGFLDMHSEESYTVEGMTEKEACSLGSRFGQYAVVVSDKEGCRLVRCPRKGR